MGSPALAAKTCTVNSDGTVTDPTTGLTWKRCAVGQTWSRTTCTGTGATYNWTTAKALTSTFAGQSDWRLPNIRELQINKASMRILAFETVRFISVFYDQASISNRTMCQIFSSIFPIFFPNLILSTHRT